MARITPLNPKDWDESIFDILSKIPAPQSPDGISRSLDGFRNLDPEERPVAHSLGTFLRHPALTEAYYTFLAYLWSETLTPRLYELAVLRTSWLQNGEYEWATHCRLVRAWDISETEVEALIVGGDDPSWTPAEAALLHAVDDLCEKQKVGDENWKRLCAEFDLQQRMDLVVVITTYIALAATLNTFGVELEPGMKGFAAR
ncbi:carboxymuconolactone decarboxylase family protein [Rhodococcus sp. NPDC003318]|uniref:carboxymuconolactone decarboxylase family protein n=1 Tax=Rhodococcus sp. NPDC003318 TaxID=3364503 RepID=UPI0036C5EA0C